MHSPWQLYIMGRPVLGCCKLASATPDTDTSPSSSQVPVCQQWGASPRTNNSTLTFACFSLRPQLKKPRLKSDSSCEKRRIRKWSCKEALKEAAFLIPSDSPAFHSSSPPSQLKPEAAKSSAPLVSPSPCQHAPSVSSPLLASTPLLPSTLSELSKRFCR